MTAGPGRLFVDVDAGLRWTPERSARAIESAALDGYRVRARRLPVACFGSLRGDGRAR